MKTVPIDPKNVAEGRTLATLVGTTEDTLVGPVTFGKPTYYQPGKFDGKVGFWRNWPEKDGTKNLAWLDAIAWWNGKSWEGQAEEVRKVQLPGVMQYLGTSGFPGIRGREVWPDPAVVVEGSGGCTITVILHNAPAESVVLDGGRATVRIVGSANAVRVHGSRPMVICKNGFHGTVEFLGCECTGQAVRTEAVALPGLKGHVRCLAALSDAGAVYIAGRGLDKQGYIGHCDIDIERLPRITPTVHWGTAGVYADDGACYIGPGSVRTQGFEFAGVSGGGSWNTFLGVSGGPVWVEDRSGWAQIKDWAGVPCRPYKVAVPEVAL